MHSFFIALGIIAMSMCAQLTVADDMGFNSENLVDSIKGAMDTIFDYLGSEDGCFYKCSNGARPVKNTAHIPQANGCGSFGVKLDTSWIPAIEKCCDQHDICYDTCNQAKNTCDDRFRDCLIDICKAMKKYVSRDITNSCKSTADMMYAATMALGCKPYRDSQKKACLCHRKNFEL